MGAFQGVHGSSQVQPERRASHRVCLQARLASRRMPRPNVSWEKRHGARCRRGTLQALRFVEGTGLTGAYTAYDSLADVANLTEGRVHPLDLTVDSQAIVRSDWALSLEVAEHIPAHFEQTLLRNWDRANAHGLVLSWSNMGSAQSAHGHVNPRRKAQVRLLLAPYGYVEDRNASSYLRRCATFLYMKRGVQVFLRNQTQLAPRPWC